MTNLGGVNSPGMEPYPTPNLSPNQDLYEILEKINFVDKIIFGKLNYNVRVSDYQDNKDFYEEYANTIIDFCEKCKIDYHIKYGTKKKDDKKTEKIFRKFPVEAKNNLIQIPQLSI